MALSGLPVGKVTIGLRLNKQCLYQEDYEIVGAGVWSSLREHGVDSSLGGYELTLPVFLMYSYEDEETEEIDELVLPRSEVLLRLLVKCEPSEAHDLHLLYFPGNLYLQEAMHMYLEGRYKHKLWSFNFFLTEKPREMQIDKLPELKLKDLEESMRIFEVVRSSQSKQPKVAIENPR